MAEPALIDTFTKDEDLATKEFLTHHLKFTRIVVAGENPSPLECLLAERVVATCLEVQLFEGLCMAGMKSGTCKQDNHRQKRLDRAHRRLLWHPHARPDPQARAGGADQHSRLADQHGWHNIQRVALLLNQVRRWMH
jgi:hypothetical protein